MFLSLSLSQPDNTGMSRSSTIFLKRSRYFHLRVYDFEFVPHLYLKDSILRTTSNNQENQLYTDSQHSILVVFAKNRWRYWKDQQYYVTNGTDVQPICDAQSYLTSNLPKGSRWCLHQTECQKEYVPPFSWGGKQTRGLILTPTEIPQCNVGKESCLTPTRTSGTAAQSSSENDSLVDPAKGKSCHVIFNSWTNTTFSCFSFHLLLGNIGAELGTCFDQGITLASAQQHESTRMDDGKISIVIGSDEGTNKEHHRSKST